MQKIENYVYGDKYNGILAQLVADHRSLLYLDHSALKLTHSRRGGSSWRIPGA
jgi:hypothetical protein